MDINLVVVMITALENPLTTWKLTGVENLPHIPSKHYGI